MLRAVDVRSVRVLLDDVFRVVEADVSYERSDGTMTDSLRRLSFERGDSAAAIVVDEERAVVVLTRQFRYPTVGFGDGWILELPAGIVEAGESPVECMRREIEEELGYRAQSLKPLRTFYSSPGGSSERIHLFYASVAADARVGPGGGTDGEEIEIIEVALADVGGLFDDDRVLDAKTLVGLNWLTDNVSTEEASQ